MEDEMDDGYYYAPYVPSFLKWTKWFAWKPVVDQHGQKHWLKNVYRRPVIKIYADGMGPPDWVYGTIFDVLSDNGASDNTTTS